MDQPTECTQTRYGNPHCSCAACQAAKSDYRTSGLQTLCPLSVMTPAVEAAMQDKGKPGRPKGFDGTRSRMPSALAQAFKRNGLDWKADFAAAIKANKRDRIKLWLKLLPYMITTTKRVPVKRWKGKASRAAIVALEAMEKEI